LPAEFFIPEGTLIEVVRIDLPGSIECHRWPGGPSMLNSNGSMLGCAPKTCPRTGTTCVLVLRPLTPSRFARNRVRNEGQLVMIDVPNRRAAQGQTRASRSRSQPSRMHEAQVGNGL
jgi:hypothetical protein